MNEQWLTEGQFSALCKEKGGEDITRFKVNRWANIGLLRRKKVRGVSYYSSSSCDQAIAIRDLLRDEKRKFEYVGWELWWRGFWVDERYWKPQLRRDAALLDRYLRRLRSRMDQESDADKTIFDAIAKSNISNIILSRLQIQLTTNELATVLRVILEVASGTFQGFEPQSSSDPRTEDQIEAGIKWRSYDEIQTINALKIGQSEKHFMGGEHLNLVGNLLPTLEDINEACSGSFKETVEGPEIGIANARDDVRNALRIALALYSATQRIYGQEAFGLKFGAWIARKSDRRLKSIFTLIWVRLRESSDSLLSSNDIALLADWAEKVRCQSLHLKSQAQDSRFAELLSPARLREAFRDPTAEKDLLSKIEAARMI
jgi:hypothetical protein